ncbi:high affinity immunoglobulin gamma Fc receptor I-like isoform X2 [Xiphophorus couchianus]|uniref:high affinity immunoglobulin gamma Fc receptor I-like isoform X2 n=1 Tax=Xiphophorus couchianus TaxID=32473 RepID=UPI0010166BA1|nr:high affinity immunoglobulin gamma Fc receptor I-like isoform X2 [Xiphophorus couchianus]
MPIKICSLCFNIVVVLIFLLGFTTKQVSPVRLTVSPSRSQFFIRESVTLICEDGNRPDGWTVRRNTSRGTRTRCEVWGKLNGSTCNMNYLVPLDTGLYWCESMSGSSSSSSSIQLSVSGGSVILQSPVLPVMEGDDVTLSCRAKNPTHNLPAAFYKDGSFIGDGPSGHMTLLHVSSTDEGLYKCNVKGHGESPSSRISVKERISSTPPSSSSPPPPPPSLPTISVVVSIFIFLVLLSLILLVLLVRRCFCRKPEDEAKDEKEITYSDLKTFRNQPIRSSRDPALVYSAVRTGDIEYGQINIRETGNQQRSREMDPGPVYSAVRTAGIRPNRTREPEPEPDVVYSAVRPADGP